MGGMAREAASHRLRHSGQSPGEGVEEPERKEDEGEGGGSLLGEVSVVTVIVSVVTIVAIVGYGLLLLFELFF